MKDTTKSALKGAGIAGTIAAVAGVVAGILLAPKSGKETRKDIAKFVGEMKDKIAKELAKSGKVTKEKYNLVVDKIVTSYEQGKKITAEEAKVIRTALDAGFDKVEEALTSKPAKEAKAKK